MIVYLQGKVPRALSQGELKIRVRYNSYIKASVLLGCVSRDGDYQHTIIHFYCPLFDISLYSCIEENIKANVTNSSQKTIKIGRM